MTNILITGVKGFIGSHLAQHLSNNKNNTIYGLYRSTKHESVFDALHLNEVENINLIQGNVNNFNDVNEAIIQYDIDQIYHLAAKVIVQDAAKFPVSTINTNVFGTLNVLESIRLMKELRNKEIPTLINSTDKIYGISDKLPYEENFPLNGQDIYSASKSCADILSRAYTYNYDLPIVITRPSNIFGLDFNWSRIIPSLAKSCLLSSEKNKSVTLNKGSYHFIREYTYIEDVTNALELLIKNINKTRNEAYNISSGFKYSTKEIVETFLQLSNNKSKQLYFKKKENIFKEIPEQYLHTQKLKSTIEWKCKYDLESGLNKTIEMYNEWFDDKSLSHYSTHKADTEICKQKLG